MVYLEIFLIYYIIGLIGITALFIFVKRNHPNPYMRQLMVFDPVKVVTSALIWPWIAITMVFDE